MNRKYLIGILLASAGLAAAPAWAQSKPGMDATGLVATAPGKAAVGDVVTVAAVVTAVDKATRAVTLKGPQGNLFRVVAGPEVRNFDQISVGDELMVTHAEALTLELKKGGAGIRERVEGADAARAAKGDKPGMASVSRVTVTADVVAINKRAQTVTLRGPEHTVELRVRDPKQFKLIAVGDQVQATYTEAIAVAMVPPAARK